MRAYRALIKRARHIFAVGSRRAASQKRTASQNMSDLVQEARPLSKRSKNN
jgi:hypothetical protein